MSKAKKALSIALAGILTAGTLFSYAPIESASAKKRVALKKRAKIKKTSIKTKQITNYKGAVTAVVVLEQGVIKYNLSKPENLAYAKAKAAIARAATQKVIPGSSKDNLINRITQAELLISLFEDMNGTIIQATVQSIETLADISVYEGSNYQVPKTVKAIMSDKSIKELKVTWDKVVDTSKIGEVLLTGRVAERYNNITLKVTVKKVDFKLESVTPINLKQVRIEFTKPVIEDNIKDAIENKNNYRIYDSNKNEVNNVINEVRLDQSNKFAIITLKDKMDSKGRSYIINNGGNYSIDINQNVFGSKINQDIRFKEVDPPTVDGIEVVGNDTIKVRFNEPIKPYNLDRIDRDESILPILDKSYFEINNGSVYVNRVELTNNNKDANIIVGSNFKDGDKITLKIKYNIENYAGIVVSPYKTDLIVKKDDSIPEVVQFKNIQNDGVTLIFNKDIKFKGIDDYVIDKYHNSSRLSDFYHTIDSYYNRASKVTINGKELNIKFQNGNIPSDSAYIYIKSDALESRWNVRNNKIPLKIKKIKDDDRPEVERVEQDGYSLDRIRVKYSRRMNSSESRRGSRNTKNYTLKDNRDKEISISRIVQDGNDEREFIIYINRDLDDDKVYTLDVEDVEDNYGNVIKGISEDFRVDDRERNRSNKSKRKKSTSIDDISGTLNNAGEDNQNITIDFDRRMTTGGDSYSVTDIYKYVLKAYQSDGMTPKKFFDGGNKSYIDVSKLYKRSISSTRNSKSVEISVPYNSSRKNDDSYDLSRVPVLKVEIARVADDDGYTTSSSTEVKVKDSYDYSHNKNRWIGFHKDPEAVSVDELHFIWNDRVSLDRDDIKVIAANNASDAERLGNLSLEGRLASDGTSSYVTGAKLLRLGKITPNYISKDYTEVNIKLEKQGDNTLNYSDEYQHILTYDGKFIDNDKNSKSVYVVVVPSQSRRDVPATQNNDDIPVKMGAFEVSDSIVPGIIDNNKRTFDHRYKGYNQDIAKEYGTTDVKDVAAELWQDGEKAVVVLTFEEGISENTLSNSNFKLSDKANDFGNSVIDRVFVKDNRVVLELSNVKNGNVPLTISEGAQISKIGFVEDRHNNRLTNLSLSLGKFQRLSKEDVKKLGANIKDTIDPSVEALRVATEAVTRAEVSKNQLDIDVAQVLVNNLAIGSSRETLQKKLDNLKILITFTATGVADYNSSLESVVRVTLSNSAYFTGVSVNGVDLTLAEYRIDATKGLLEFKAKATASIKVKTLYGEIPVKVIQMSVTITNDSEGKPGNGKITNLGFGKTYIVEVDNAKYGVKADGRLGAEADIAPLNGTEIIELDNMKTYKVLSKILPQVVTLFGSSKGVAGDGKITGLESGKLYTVEDGTKKYGVKDDGTLVEESQASPLIGMEITGLDNTKSYRVAEGVNPVVKLLDGSLGTAEYKKITGLQEQKTYIVECDTEKYGVKSNGTLGLESQAAPLIGTQIIGLENTRTYKVSKKVVVSKIDVWQENENAVIVLTFDESINKGTVLNSTFMLSNRDFGYSKIDKIFAKDNMIIFQLSDVRFGCQTITIKKGYEIFQMEAFKTSNNSDISGLTIILGEFNKLTNEQVNLLIKP